MKPGSVRLLLGAIVSLLVVGGCATQPRMVADTGNRMVSVDIGGLPQTVLPGASIEHARSLTMALARTRGWEIRQAAANQVVLERPLRADAPERAALGATGSPLSPPRRQVQTNLVEGRDGAIVALRAFVVADPGTPGERRIDITEQSQAAFQDSFASLQRAWADGRGQIVRPLPTLTEEQVAASSGAVDRALATPATGAPTPTPAPTTGTPASGRAATPAPVGAPQPAGPAVAAGRPASAPAGLPTPLPTPLPTAPAAPPSAPVAGSVATPVAAPAPVATARQPAAPLRRAAPIMSTNPAMTAPPAGTTASGQPIPIRSATTIGAGGALAGGATALPAERNDMLALDAGTARKGLWAYYAEDYAQLRGCNVADQGAVLLTETDGYEVHEVHCASGPNFLMRCQGGVCEQMR